jgi:ribosomal protein L14E/L6E/L27E
MSEGKVVENLQKKKITESSLKLYLANLKRLNGGEVPKNLIFLKDVEKVLEKIKDYKPNTRRSYLISIVSLLKDEPKQKKLYEKYYALLDEYNKDLKTQNTKSDTQKENWISQEQVKEIYNTLTERVSPFFTQKKISKTEYETLLSWVVLSLYVLQPPRRNIDYLMMVLTNKYTPVKEGEQDTKNYLDLPENRFHYLNYKTKGTYKEQTADVPPELMMVIARYLVFHPLAKGLKKKTGQIPFLVDYEGQPLTNSNAITRILNKIFGKRIGVSMLRNIYLTDKYKDKVDELQQDATAMGTSSNTIENNYVKVD